MIPTWAVIVTPEALAQMAMITDQRVQRQLRAALLRLEQAPDKIGKPLTGDLAGFHSMRAAGQRYRILYRLVEDQVLVYVVSVGLRQEGSRRDVYAQAARLLAGWTPAARPDISATSVALTEEETATQPHADDHGGQAREGQE